MRFGASAMLIVQVVIAAFAMLPVTSEYATGSIRSTLQWTPVRRDVVLAKAAVLAPVLFVYGIAMVGARFCGQAVWRWLLGRLGRDRPRLDLLSVASTRPLAGLFTAGIAFLIRSTAGTLTAAFLLLLVVPLMLGQASFAPWCGQRPCSQAGPARTS